MKPYISIIICTTGRHEMLQSCLTSITNNHYSNYEIIIVSFGKLPSSIASLGAVLYTNTKGLGQARNLGIRASKGEILAFTDDDCIVGKNWLRRIDIDTKYAKKADVFFGQVLPYKPQNHRDEICPSIMTNKKVRIYDKPIMPSIVGSGNNMILRKRTVEENGYFKQWLGPGSIGKNADDTEMILRLLSKGKIIKFNPAIVVYHNRWLTDGAYRNQYLEYIFGDAANYTYHSLNSGKTARHLLTSLVKKNVRQIFRFQNKRDVFQILCGSCIGTFFFMKEVLVHTYDE